MAALSVVSDGGAMMRSRFAVLQRCWKAVRRALLQETPPETVMSVSPDCLAARRVFFDEDVGDGGLEGGAEVGEAGSGVGVFFEGVEQGGFEAGEGELEGGLGLEHGAGEFEGAGVARRGELIDFGSAGGRGGRAFWRLCRRLRRRRRRGCGRAGSSRRRL